MIIRSGENIAAAEVERVLETHPFVRQAVAVGCPDDRVGERVAAFVVGDRRLDVEECRRWFAAQGVARFKTPELVVHLDAIPLLGLGKPDRAALRDAGRRRGCGRVGESGGHRTGGSREWQREEYGRMTTGIVAWGAYLPYWRLERAAIGAAFGTPAARGQRAVASYDEDTTTLGVEAARRALRADEVPDPAELYFSTPDPAYMDKTNATTVHAALGLEPTVGAYDLCGSVRSAWGALRAAALAGQQQPALAVISDLRTGLAGGAEESQAGDGAVAFVFAPDGGVAETLSRASRTDEFLDRWRVPGESASRQWEERFGEEALVPLARACFRDALAGAGLAADDIDHLVVTGLHGRAVAAVRGSLGVPADRLAADESGRIGNLGAAQAAWSLAGVLERAEPDQVIAVLTVGDGADAHVLRTTAELPAARARRRAAGLASLEELAAAGRSDLALRAVPHLARPVAQGTAPASGPGATRCAGHAPQRALEVRVRGQSLHGLRLRAPAAHPGVPVLPFGRQDGTAAAGRRAGHGGHLHRRPPGLQPLATPRRGRHRLRRRRPLPGRDDRRRPGRPVDRHPSGDDLPAVLYGTGRA